jgi:hypothetical protein
VNHLRRRYQRCKEQNIRLTRKELYFNERNSYIDLIKKQKLKSWQKLCFESKAWGLPYKLINNKIKTENSIPNFKRNDGTYTQTQEESLHYALKHMFPDDDQQYDNLIHQNIRQYSEIEPNTSDDLDFTLNELREVINNLKPNKACGWDQINEKIIKALFESEPDLLLDLLNICLKYGYFPKIWKISVIKILLKSADKPKNEVKSYRPISLLPLMAKIFERLIINRINHHLFTNNFLSKSQFGFTPNKSTEDALEYVHQLGKKVLKNKAYLLIVVLDIKGAFDNCWWSQILKQLKDKKCSKNLFK